MKAKPAFHWVLVALLCGLAASAIGVRMNCVGIFLYPGIGFPGSAAGFLCPARHHLLACHFLYRASSAKADGLVRLQAPFALRSDRGGAVHGGHGFQPGTVAVLSDRNAAGFGWENAYLVMAAAILLFTLPALLVPFTTDPRQMGMRPYGDYGEQKGSYRPAATFR